MENLICEQANFVPNEQPRLLHTVPYRIAIIGEAPGADEVVAKRPFVGVSGRLLDYLLSRVGILRSACLLGNVSQLRPPGNDITAFDWKGEEIQEGLRILTNEIADFNPNLCLLLGATALRAAKGYYESITNWRGSLFTGGEQTPFAGRKCLATYHPAAALRVYEQTAIILFDLKRARTEGESKDLVLPERQIEVAKTVEDVEVWFQQHKGQNLKMGTDIEGYVDNLTCISFSDSPTSGFVIPFSGGGGNYWSPDDEGQVWKELKQFLEDPTTYFVLQNGLYDRFVLAYTYGILITGVIDDTLVKHWELYCELPKRLSLQASLYTKEPYYKDERDSTNFNDFWTYNGKDSCVTLEISNRQDSQLVGLARQHYEFNMAMQNPLLYMELRGMCYDSEESHKIANEIRSQVFILQHALNKIVGNELNVTSESEAIKLVSEVMYVKKTPLGLIGLWPRAYCRKSYLDSGSFDRTLELCKQGFPFDDARNGELSMLLDKHLNTASSQQLQSFLYGSLGLPQQLKRGTRQPTTDALALLSLFKKTENPVLKLILKITQLRTQLETLEIKCDPDNRIRCSYNVVGTETGRLSCKQSPTRSGYNLQTVTKKQRRLFLADKGCYFFQCDLSGADGWTVAAHCKRLGDSTMLDDYLYGLKPAKLIGLMYQGINLTKLSREEIKLQSEKITSKDPNSWLYMACKRVQHGSNYLMGKLTMSNQILQDGWKYGDDIIYVESRVCEELQVLYFQRYPGVQVWHRWVAEQVKNRRELTSANGHTRRFFGRPYDNDTLKQALADEPQNNTTYVTNRAALHLWNDRENRRATGAFIIEPLHQVHDALCGQFPVDRTEWALSKIRSYFTFNTTIAGQVIQIPFEGAYGKSWGELTEPI